MSYWNRFPEYVSVAEKKKKAAKKLKQLQKKMPDIKPVILEGKALAQTWWGKSWNQNLERYADYSNRIDRGRSYVRHGAVLDLGIEAGTVRALVLGSSSRPYEVTIRIKAISATQWTAIKKQCDGRLKSLQDLLSGKFPRELSDIFLTEGKGLFPSPKEISFDCSCPDWASMCKHVASALYGIGARLDEDPSLFFTLRGVSTDDLVVEAIQDQTAEMLAKAERKSTRVIKDTDLSSLFGLELATPPSAFLPEKTKPALKKSSKQKAAAQKPPKSSTKTPIRRNRTPLAPIDLVAAIIARSKIGVDSKTLSEKTGLPKTKIYALVRQMKLQGKIKNKSHGVYVKVRG
ncbi:MAG: SWIM zinc finger family protein [Desulfurivibrionaceae bacterium]|jgi:uncharacterized Zn finger protein